MFFHKNLYRFKLLTDKSMGMFDVDSSNNHQIEMLNLIPLTYEKLEEMKNKYITPEIEKKFIEEYKSRGLTEERFYELLNANSCKAIEDIYLDELEKIEEDEEFE